MGDHSVEDNGGTSSLMSSRRGTAHIHRKDLPDSEHHVMISAETSMIEQEYTYYSDDEDEEGMAGPNYGARQAPRFSVICNTLLPGSAADSEDEGSESDDGDEEAEDRGSLGLVDDDESDDDETVEREDARAMKKAKRGVARAAKRALRKVATRARSDSDSESSSESEENGDEQAIAPIEPGGDVAAQKRGTCVSMKPLGGSKSPKSDDDVTSRSSKDSERNAIVNAGSDLQVVDLENDIGSGNDEDADQEVPTKKK